MAPDPGRLSRFASEITLLARLIRDNPDLPDARRHWARQIRDLAARAAAPPGDDNGTVVVAWPGRAGADEDQAPAALTAAVTPAFPPSPQP